MLVSLPLGLASATAARVRSASAGEPTRTAARASRWQSQPIRSAYRSRCSLEPQLIEVERDAIARAYEQIRITDEARRRIERKLDLQEPRVRHAPAGASYGTEA
jgi:hypothetical protein